MRCFFFCKIFKIICFYRYSAIYQRQLRYMEESSVRKLQNRSGTFRKSNFESLGKNNILRNDNLQVRNNLK